MVLRSSKSTVLGWPRYWLGWSTTSTSSSTPLERDVPKETFRVMASSMCQVDLVLD
ncbi:MAG: hypothetical protein ACJAQ3_001367 [Planctomycetota bacterium]|jgi:hypothetical protein